MSHILVKKIPNFHIGSQILLICCQFDFMSIDVLFHILCRAQWGTLWARVVQNVKKPPLTVNVIDFEFFGFNVSIWVPWSPLGPKKS